MLQVALKLLDQLGQQYEQEHEKDLTDLVRFGQRAHKEGEAQFLEALQQGALAYGGENCLAGQSGAAGTAAGRDGRDARLEQPQATATAAAASVNSSAGTGPAVFRLPVPFTQRPRLGSRLVVANNFSAAMHALCAELSSWQSGPRAMSARLLRVNLALVESAAERHLQVWV